MDFFCSFFKQDQHHVEIYSVPAKHRPKINNRFTETGPSRNSNQLFSGPSQRHFINLAQTVPVRRFDSETTIDESRRFKLKSNPNPEQPRYFLVETKAIPKDGLLTLLRNKEKQIQGEIKGSQNIVMRMVKKSDYKQKANSKYNGKKWQDQSFPPVQTYNGPDQNNKKHQIKLVWPFLSDLCKMMNKKCCFMDDHFESSDIIQGSVGDCYFLSAVAALVLKTERVPRLFPNCELNDNGVYMAQLMFKGILQEVMVDERFPYDQVKKQLLGCRSKRQPFEIYGMVLEKCWAKLWKSYQKIDSGFPNQALHALTGAPSKNYILKKETETAQLKQSFFKQVLGFNQADFVMCAGTHVTYSKISMMKVNGDRTVKLPQSHIFCVEKIYEDLNKQKMVRLYNPWGQNWTDGANIQGRIDTTWEEFIQKFRYLTACKVKDNANYLFMELQGCKKGKFKFIELNVDDPRDGQIAISLSQTDRKELDMQKPYLTTTFFAVKCITDGPNVRYQYVSIRTNYEHPDHYFELSKVTNGKYIIGMYFSEVEVKENLTFGVYSEAIFGLKEVSFDEKRQQTILEQTFKSYQLKKPSNDQRVYLSGKDKDVWYSFDVMFNGSIFGYLMLHVGKNEKSWQIAMGRNAVTSTNLTMWEPYNAAKICLKGEPGTDKIVFMTVDKLLDYREKDRQYIDKNTRFHIKNILISKS